MTAAQLLRTLAPARPRVDGCELVLAAPPPPHLHGPLLVLQTGVRAAITGRPWFAIGIDGRGLGPLTDGEIDPDKPLPWLARRLCVAGDARWDALPDWWRLDLPHLFGPPPKKLPPAHATSARRCPYIPLGVAG